MFRILVILLPLLLLPFDLPAENSGSLPDCEIIIDNFKDGIDAGWMMKSFKGETDYTWVNDAERNHIKATSSNTASSL